ncbi:MAG: TIGR03943 family putative permease subunit [Actinomycetota bacterium]
MRTAWSPRRVATGLVLAGWAALFWFVILTGRTPLYLSSRTGWVAPVGAVLLTAAAGGRLLSSRARRPAPLGRDTAWRLGFLALPVVALLVLPPTTLGSYAASRRSLAGAGFGPSAGQVGTGEVTLADVAAAVWSPEAAAALTERAGSRVAFVGIVVRRGGMPADEFLLTRFIVTCCVADALSVQVRVVGAPPGGFEQDQWVRVAGTIYPLGREVILQASEITPVPRPARPYLQV